MSRLMVYLLLRVTESFIGSYTLSAISIILYLTLVVGTAVAIIVISSIIGRRPLSAEKSIPYECGMLPLEKPDALFSIQFYKVALLFVIFDVETVFLYLWAIVVKDLKLFGLIEMVVFIAILLVAFIYVWRKGDLHWD